MILRQVHLGLSPAVGLVRALGEYGSGSPHEFERSRIELSISQPSSSTNSSPSRAYWIARARSGSSSPSTVRRSHNTPRSVTRQKTGGDPVRSRAAIAFGSRERTSTPYEGIAKPGSDPPPTADEHDVTRAPESSPSSARASFSARRWMASAD